MEGEPSCPPAAHYGTSIPLPIWPSRASHTLFPTDWHRAPASVHPPPRPRAERQPGHVQLDVRSPIDNGHSGLGKPQVPTRSIRRRPRHWAARLPHRRCSLEKQAGETQLLQASRETRPPAPHLGQQQPPDPSTAPSYGPEHGRRPASVWKVCARWLDSLGSGLVSEEDIVTSCPPASQILTSVRSIKLCEKDRKVQGHRCTSSPSIRAHAPAADNSAAYISARSSLDRSTKLPVVPRCCASAPKPYVVTMPGATSICASSDRHIHSRRISVKLAAVHLR